MNELEELIDEIYCDGYMDHLRDDVKTFDSLINTYRDRLQKACDSVARDMLAEALRRAREAHRKANEVCNNPDSPAIMMSAYTMEACGVHNLTESLRRVYYGNDL